MYKGTATALQNEPQNLPQENTFFSRRKFQVLYILLILLANFFVDIRFRMDCSMTRDRCDHLYYASSGTP
jgi:hypothetical protein